MPTGNTERPYDSPGVHETVLKFDHPYLKGWEWPVIEIVGAREGPRLCVLAGIHVNEVSSIEAAIRLRDRVDPAKLSGRISVMPVANQPAIDKWSIDVCPVDNKNMNFCFPGDLKGTFSQVLAHYILHDWASGADGLIDMHGGDLSETITQFTMARVTGNAELNGRIARFAQCFNSDFRVEFQPDDKKEHIRAAITFPDLYGKPAVMSEAGFGGVVSEEAVSFHLDGIIRVAAEMGMIDRPVEGSADLPPLVRAFGYMRSNSPSLYYPLVRPNDRFEAGKPLARLTDYYGNEVQTFAADRPGRIVMEVTHLLVRPGQLCMLLGYD
jgi:uncharacterized protein